MEYKMKIYLERAEKEIIIGKTNLEISINKNLKKTLNIPEHMTFLNDVISEFYYSIFYAAKAYLILKGIETSPPNEHKKTYNKFKKLVKSGKIDKKLIEIYDTEAEKAEVLLNIFQDEKKKRGRFVYNVDFNANIPYASESMENAIKFVSTIKMLIEKESSKV